jgi:hypothetical protein
MFKRIDIPRSDSSSSDTARLISDYFAFDRQRSERRQYTKAFGGMAVLVLLGGVFGRVPRSEAWVVAGLLLLPPLVLAALEIIRWHRLERRLDRVREQLHAVQSGRSRAESIGTKRAS